MPTYDYRCPNGHTFELFQRMSDPLPAECGICGAAPVKRLFSPVAVHFKGSGFYATDYGRGAKKRDAGKDGDGSAGEPKKKDEKASAAAPSSSPPSASSGDA